MVQKFTPYIWLAAFICSLFFINDWQLQLFTAAVILISIWTILSFTLSNPGSFIISKSWCLGLMGAFWLLVFLSVLGSDILNVSLMSFCFFSVLPLTFLTLSAVGNDQVFKIIGQVLIGIFIVLSVWALIQFFVFNEHFGGRATHPLKNPNSLAALFSLGFICGLGGVINATDKHRLIWASLFCCLTFAAFVVAGSRGALFALIPVLGVFLYVMRSQVKDNWKVIAGIFVFTCASLFLFDLYGNPNENLGGRMVDTMMGQAKTGDISNNRFALWAASWGIIKEHGWLGTGIGTFFLYFPEFRLPSDRFGAFYAHSDPLQYWVELGVLGPLLFYGFSILMIGRTTRAVQQTQDKTTKLLILTPFFAVAACVLHAHVTFNFYNLSILFLVGFLLGFWFAQTQKILKTSSWIINWPAQYSMTSRVIILALPFVFIVSLFSAYVLSEHYTNKARDYLLAGELEDFADNVLMANKVSMRGNYRSYLLAVNVPMTLLQDQSDKLSREQKHEIYDQAMSYLKQVQFINPRSASAHYYLAKIQQIVPKDFIEEGLPSAQFYYQRALKLDPVHVGSRIELSHIYEKDLLSLERAVSLIEEGLHYRYNTSKAMDLYSRAVQLYLKSGDSEGRDAALKKMQNFQRYLNRYEEKKNKSLWNRFSTEEGAF